MSEPLLLLVDDAREMGLIVERLAGRAGCALAYREDAASALEFLRECQPDLVLLDVNLVGMSGPEMCRRLRADGRLARLPVALFTHEDLGDDIVAGLEAGADFLFSKDLVATPESWCLRLREILTLVHGHPAIRSLRSIRDEVVFPIPADWIAAVNGALRTLARRGLAPQAVRAILRRALSLVFMHTDTDYWLSADGCSLDSERVPPGAVRAAGDVAAALVEQVWRVTGTAASASFRAAMVAAFPALPESLTH
jgi:CheY-like chemotaxis protein